MHLALDITAACTCNAMLLPVIGALDNSVGIHIPSAMHITMQVELRNAIVFSMLNSIRDQIIAPQNHTLAHLPSLRDGHTTHWGGAQEA